MATGTRSPIEPKAQAAGLAGTAAGIVIWILQTYAFKGNDVPAGLVSLIYAAVPGIVALTAAYFAPHQARPGDIPIVVSSGGGGGGGGTITPVTPPPAPPAA